jgi:hypothetical protein
MTDQHLPVPITEMQGVQPVARECIETLIQEMTGSTDMSMDFYREWSGGWRVDVEVRGPISGNMDFILFQTPQGGVLAMPAQLPQRWRTEYGVAASDGSRWTFDDEGRLCPMVPPSPAAEQK